MKNVLDLVEKGAKWYFKEASKNFYLTSTGSFPISDSIEKRK
jgi:hypothetical protein